MTLSSEKQHLTCKAYGPMVPQNDEFELFPWQNKIGTIPQMIPKSTSHHSSEVTSWGHDQIHPDVFSIKKNLHLMIVDVPLRHIATFDDRGVMKMWSPRS